MFDGPAGCTRKIRPGWRQNNIFLILAWRQFFKIGEKKNFQIFRESFKKGFVSQLFQIVYEPWK